MTKYTVPALLFVFSIAANAQPGSAGHGGIDALTGQLYAALTFSNGHWTSAKDLGTFFFPGARLIANYDSIPQVWTVEQYVQGIEDRIAKQGLVAVEEKELFATTDVFGKVAQRFSTYQIRIVINGKETLRQGINCMQFIQERGSWKLTSLVWDRESKTLKIPSQYKAK